MVTDEGRLSRLGIDAVALKPTECDVSRAVGLDVDAVTIDYEGREALPDAETIASLARETAVRVTTPVRADGFDPLGDDRLWDWPAIDGDSLWERRRARGGVRADGGDALDLGRVLVAGHPAYLSEEERGRAVAPRLGAAIDRTEDPWVGTEGVERIATATGATQFELLSRSTTRDVRSMRAAGFDGGIAVYAPTAVTDDEDAVIDALGHYAARRPAVADALPDGAATDATAAGRAREVLSKAVRDVALVGDERQVRERVAALREAGVDRVVAYPARGLDAVLA